MTPLELADFAALLAERKLSLEFRRAGVENDLDEIRQQLAQLRELIMSILSDIQAKFANMNATAAASVLTIQQLRQAHDAALEALAVAQAAPQVPAGGVVLSAADVAALNAALASAEDSRQAVADAIEANALNQTPAPAPAPAAP